MILLSMGLLGFGALDLVRWSPDKVGAYRAAGAVAAGAAAAAALAGLAGACLGKVLLAAAVSAAVLAVWVSFDYWGLKKKPGASLGWLAMVIAVLFAASGSVDSISGPLERWYANLAFGFVGDLPVDQFVLGLSAVVFMAASGNRIVRLVLDAAGVSRKTSESALKGGRLLGPLERLIVFAIVLAGDPAAAAIVITGKGLLRFPEIRSEAGSPGPDAVTEYFLIGTFVSLLIASLLAVVVLAAG
ncbi:MAG: hypothetical protein ACTHO8_09125 [Solirubrobacterales bacterium]